MRTIAARWVVVVVVTLAAAGVAGAAESPADAVASAAAVAPSGGAASREPGRPGSFQVSAAFLYLAASTLGATDATLTANDTGGSAYRLFSTSGRLEGAAGIDGRVAYQVTRLIGIEGSVSYSRPGITFSVSNDAEGAAAFSAAGETVSQILVEANVVVYPWARGLSGGSMRPFVEAGAGYLRELHGQATAMSGYYSADGGRVYHAGGGVLRYFGRRSSGWIRSYGLRADGRVSYRSGGFSFGGAHPTTFALGVGLVAAF